MTEVIPKIGIAVLTYRRPKLLQETLLSLQQQTIASWHTLQLQILVVDNDPAMSGQATFLGVQKNGGVPMRYCAEPTPGLATARNRALSELQDMDFIAFIDDDETADPGWLEELLRVQHQYDADVVTGPVEPRFHEPPPWILQGRFFAARHMPTGSEPHVVETNNVLFRASLVRTFRFNPVFDSSSGEDTHFFLQLKRAGHSLVWADRAVVYDTVAPERVTARWLIRRAYSDAYRFTHVRLVLDPTLQTRMARAVAASANFALGSVALPLAVLGKHRAVKALRRIARAAGTLAALMGRPHDFYGIAAQAKKPQ